jgi:hypothetical protein
MKTSTLILTILACVSCTKSEETLPNHDNDKFELTAARAWTLVNEQGIDTYVGYYHKADYKIYFDFGILAYGSIDSIKNTPDLLHYEELFINGNKAKITKEERDGRTLLFAYIDKGDGIGLNKLSTFNTSDDQLFFKIIKSHKFK